LYVLKASKNVLLHRTNIKKSLTLRSLCMAITYSCNYKCTHCFTKEIQKMRRDEALLTLDDYKTIAEQAMKLGAISFAFQGGEIWLRKDYREIIEVFQPKKHYITVTTNGKFISPTSLKELEEIGVDIIFFSLNSGIAEKHDEMSGHPGSYDIVMKAIKLTMESKIRVGINCVLSKLNLYTEEFRSLIDFAEKHGIVLNIIFARALGRWKEHQDIMLSDDDIKYYNRKIMPFYPILSRDLYYNYNGVYGCPAAKESFYINPWGDVLACPFNHTSFGNLKEEMLVEMQKRSAKIKWFKDFHPVCLTAEDRQFMEKYYEGLNEKGIVDYSFWIKKDK